MLSNLCDCKALGRGHIDIGFDSDTKERTTSSGTKMQPLLSDPPFGAITCKAGNRICSSLTAENPLTGTRFCDLFAVSPFSRELHLYTLPFEVYITRMTNLIIISLMKGVSIQDAFKKEISRIAP
ncbi:hypothetical protein H5410_032317 [Solanum commersonii]|uniref:Uncharacterized protein n=1 Tax=Solanum commersonii TaxID=4109 RepID=A0A9J5YJM8_SOLCO|nr:hypothetical protein H5410_032317 [Solanum commersonii]